MATSDSEVAQSKEIEAGVTEKTLPPPYAEGTGGWNYGQMPSASATNAGYNQPAPGYPGYPQAGYSNIPVMPVSSYHDDPMHIPASPEAIVVLRERESFTKQIVLSCLVFWLCCWPLGLTAFILAMIANSKSKAADEFSATEAHQLGKHSFRTSIAGVILGIIFLIIFIALKVAAANNSK